MIIAKEGFMMTDPILKTPASWYGDMGREGGNQRIWESRPPGGADTDLILFSAKKAKLYGF